MSWACRRRMGTPISIVILLLLQGCLGGIWPRRGWKEDPIVENPFPEVRQIAVAEFRDWSGQGVDGWALADFFAAELAQVGFFEVLPVMQVKAAAAEAGLDSKDPTSALLIAKRLQADAVVLGGVTTYDPYIPKRLGLSVVMLTTGADLSPEGVRLIMELERTGKAMRVFSPSAAEGIIAYKARIFDASYNEVVEEAKAYAARRKGRQGPLGWRAYVEITEEFLRFACNRLIHQMLTEQLLMKGATGASGT